MSDRTCSIDGCGKPVHGYGWCRVHYFNWKHHNDPLWVNEGACAWCGKPFDPGAMARRKYCDLACGRADRAKAREESNIAAGLCRKGRHRIAEVGLISRRRENGTLIEDCAACWARRLEADRSNARTRMLTPEDFWVRGRRDLATGCLMWSLACTTKGYGSVSYQGDWKQAHVLAWELTHDDPIPPGMVICHHCDTPPCFEPAHLFLGTQKDNVQDSIRKGRHSSLHLKKGWRGTPGRGAA